jgi:hypothetical protein
VFTLLPFALPIYSCDASFRLEACISVHSHHQGHFGSIKNQQTSDKP